MSEERAAFVEALCRLNRVIRVMDAMLAANGINPSDPDPRHPDAGIETGLRRHRHLCDAKIRLFAMTADYLHVSPKELLRDIEDFEKTLPTVEEEAVIPFVAL